MAENRNIEIGGRLHSIATGNVVTGANEIFDDSKNKKQSDINTETYSLVNDVNERLSGLSPDQQSALNVAAKATNNEIKLGYYVCDTEGNVAAKVISNATGYVLSPGGSIKIKMTNANTANNATLNINSTGAKALYYDGERASANNSWEAGEVVELFYDGTSFYANSVAGGSGSGDGAFDISAKTGNTYETLSAAVTAANSILSAGKKKGGMSIKFILRINIGTEEAPVYKDKYVQYRYMGTETTGNPNPFLDTTNWQGVDNKPTAGSRNLVESGGVDKITRKLTFSDTDNILDVYPVLAGADGISNENDEWIGASNKFHSKTFNVDAEQGAYTLSFKGYSEQNQQASGTVFKMIIKYSDNSTTELLMSTNTPDWTQRSVTSNSSKQITSISFSYGVGGDNIIHIKEIQLRKGLEVQPYIPPVSVVDINAGNLRGEKIQVSKELEVSSSVQHLINSLTNVERICLRNISNSTNLNNLEISITRNGVASYDSIQLVDGAYKNYAGADLIRIYTNANTVTTAGTLSFDLYTEEQADINRNTASIANLNDELAASNERIRQLEGSIISVDTTVSSSTNVNYLLRNVNWQKFVMTNVVNESGAPTLQVEYRKTGDTSSRYLNLDIVNGTTFDSEDAGTVIRGIYVVGNKITHDGGRVAIDFYTNALESEGEIRHDISEIQTNIDEIEDDLSDVHDVVDNIELLPTYNILDLNALLANKSGLSYSNGVWSGKIVDFQLTHNIVCDEGAYALSFVGKCEGNASTSGSGLQVRLIYTDNSYAQAILGNNVSEFRKLSVVSSASKQIAKIQFTYGSGGQNIIHIKEMVLAKGSTVMPYVPAKSIVDYVARVGLERITPLEEAVSTIGTKQSVSKELVISSSIQEIIHIQKPSKICIRNISNTTNLTSIHQSIRKTGGTVYDGLVLIEGNYYTYTDDVNEVVLYLDPNVVTTAGTLSFDLYTEEQADIAKGAIPKYDLIESNRTHFNELLQQLKRETRYQLNPGSWNGRPKPISLLYFSDVHHGNNKQLVNIKRFMDVYNSFLNDAIHTGDSMGSKYSDSEGFSWWDNNGLQKVLNVIGNHDVIDDGGVINSYNRYMAPYVSLWGITQPADAAVDGLCYYYKDYDTSGQNIRLIVIDCMHYDSAQNTWLGTVLEDARTNSMGVVIATHYPVGSENYILPNTSFTSLQVAISEFTSTDAVTTVDTFIENGGEFICWLTGHLHADVLFCLTTHHNQFCISTANDNSYNTQYNDNGRALYTKPADNFNVVAFDRYSKIVKLARFGGNYDRWMRHKETFCWDYENAQFIYTD